MVDALNSNGLTVMSYSDLLAAATTAFQGIYGNDINLNSNSADGQLVNFIAQMSTDVRELIVATYNSFSQDRASGVMLDERASLINQTRRSGSFTITPITVVVNTATSVNLQGLDSNINSITATGYTISDNAGNQYILTDSQTNLVSGTYTLNFRAANIGLVTTIPNTITNQVTIILGVTSVNNPTGASVTGVDEETDTQFRLQCQETVAQNARSSVDALEAALYNIPGVTQAFVYENLTESTDVNGIPPHGIWVIVENATAYETQISQAIYNQLNCQNMKGSISVPITTTSGQIFLIKFDQQSYEPLYIKFNIQPTKSGATFDTTAIANTISENLNYGINQYAETSLITQVAASAIQTNGGNGVPTEVHISIDGSTWVDYIPTSNLNMQFSVSSSNISITVI